MTTNPQISNYTQQCTVTSLYRIWGAFAIGIAIFARARNWTGLAIWLVAAPLIKWTQVRFYPQLSNVFGYGSVSDDPAKSIQAAPVAVTYYSALGCPFCPIVLKRLKELQKAMGFTLTTVDVSLHPRFLQQEGIRSVPVVAVGNQRVVGNATSEQLARLIANAPAMPAVS